MPSESGSDDGGVVERLRRCIRDLSVLNALPSMCIGRTPREALDTILDALPTALGCELVYLLLPGSPPAECGTLRGISLPGAQLEACRKVAERHDDAPREVQFASAGRLVCFVADVPIASERGRLLAGRTGALDPETDRALVRAAANLTGATLESANELETARRKDEFLAMLGHELRNPLAPILTAVEILARQPEVVREQTVIERHARHLARLVDDLLDISRITRGHIELRNERVTLAAVLQGAVELAQPLIDRARHSLRVDGVAGITLQGDPVRLAQILGNLLTNAAKYTDPGGAIEVRVERASGRVRVAVRDNGRGLPADHIERVFEPFVQVRREADARSGGLGLGLAIVRDLVQRHGGSVRAHSDGPGRGSTFTVELPTVDAAIAVTRSEPPAPAPSRRGNRILVVDDSADIADLVAEALRHEGYDPTVAYDAESAIEAWRAIRPDAAVFDVGMPGTDGYALARAIRREFGAAPLLIAATGYGQPRDRARATEAGFDVHFVKPVSVQDLVRVLDQRLARDRTTPSATPGS